MSKTLQIGANRLGEGCPTYVIAEMSGNHNQSLDRAIELVRAARRAGADAVKLQTYTADTLTLDSDQPYFIIQADNPWKGRTLHSLYQEASTPWDWHPKLFEVAREEGLDCFSSPFDPTAVDFLETLDAPAYKIASFELVDIPLLRKVAATGKPVIASTGMATRAEIDEAVSTLRAGSAAGICLLKCTSAYPADPKDMNLRTIPSMEQIFGTLVGLSDHTLGSAVALAAVALGTSVVEKHLTLRRADGGPDASFSMEPDEFKAMVEQVRIVEQALGQVSYDREAHELTNLPFRRSLFVVADIKRGEVFTEANVRSVRPADGLHTRYLEDILGKTAACDIRKGTPLAWRHIAD